MITTKILPHLVVGSLAAAFLASPAAAADPAPVASGWQKPAWLSELSIGAKESNDDNVMGVSGLGMPTQSAWVTTLSFRLGLNLVPLLGDQKAIQTFSLTYTPDVVSYENLSQENYTAHRLGSVLKGKSGNVVFSVDNAFLYNDGSHTAPTYALNQLAGVAANQNDKFRNNYAHSLARERRNQVQDRYTVSVQFNQGDFFLRPMSNMTYFNLNTDLHNTGAAPYKGYQDYVDRYDVNGGIDAGWKATKDLAVTIGYRQGYQYQQQFAVAINADQHASDSHYQRVLVGLEGKIAGQYTVKIAVGPDFRDYAASAAMNSLTTTRWYGEANIVDAIAPNQSLTLGFKQWVFVASTGLAPYEDVTTTLTYHWSVDKQWGVDIGVKKLEANYTMGNEITGGAPSLRDDIDYGGSIGVTYAVNKNLILSATYNYDSGRNGLDNLPATLFASYRHFDHNVVGVGVQYKF